MGLLKKGIRTAGFSLVEIIIAVAILGIVTVPVMTSLVRTAQINQKARILQKGTDLAQNFMETLRAETKESLVSAIYGSDISAGTDETTVDFTPLLTSLDGYTVSNYEELDALTFRTQVVNKANSAGAIEKTAYWGMGNDQYYFAITDVEYNSSTFDVLIMLDGPAYGTAADNPKYYTYNVTVMIYSSVGKSFSSDTKVTQLETAIQNK
ncbi:MAG: type II secretion system GspH family protein [Lachnospiraceae bacterium]|nr:type II secretion system GspH family protein [Lachnospiraceae bacterium]